MLYRRYANPLELLKTYSLKRASDFILYAADKESEARVYKLWLTQLNSMSGKSINEFEKFKKAQKYKPIRKQKGKKLVSKEEEKRRIDNVINIFKIKPSRKGGEQ